MPALLSAANIRLVLAKLTAAATQALVGSTNASPSVANVTAHGLAIGDFVAVFNHATNTNLNGLRTVAAAGFDANHVSFLDAITGAAVNGNGVGGGTGSIQRITNGMQPHDLENLADALDRYGYARGTDGNFSAELTAQSIFGL